MLRLRLGGGISLYPDRPDHAKSELCAARVRPFRTAAGTAQAPAMASRFQQTHSAKNRLARRRKRVRPLLHAYTAIPQPANLTTNSATVGRANTRIRPS